MPARTPSTHHRGDARPTGTTSWGEEATTAVAPEQTGGAFTLAVVGLPVGWHRPWYVDHRLDECFVVRSGRLRVQIEDREEPFVAEPGDTVYVPRGLARSLSLAEASPATLLVLHTPALPAPVPPPGPDGRWLHGVELLDPV